MSETQDKLAEVVRLIAEGVEEREAQIQRIADLPPRSPDAHRERERLDTMNEALAGLRRYRAALEAFQGQDEGGDE